MLTSIFHAGTFRFESVAAAMAMALVLGIVIALLYKVSDVHMSSFAVILETAFRILSKEECQIIILHAVSGLKHREIGGILHLPLSTVLSKYNRGIKKLRAQLEESL